MKIKVTFLIFVALIILSCNKQSGQKVIEPNTNKVKHQKKNHNGKKHWTYNGETGPEHWNEIEKESDCGGNSQSPINIIEVNTKIDNLLKPIETHYSSNIKIHDITNNGHSIQYNFEKGDYIVLNDVKYQLKQFHFHESSEHTINGVRYPLEIHLVHVSNHNKIIVLSIMAIEGESSEPFTFLEKYLPIEIGETKLIDDQFDMNQNLPKNK